MATAADECNYATLLSGCSCLVGEEAGNAALALCELRTQLSPARS